MGYGDDEYDAKVLIDTTPAYERVNFKKVKIAGPYDTYDLKVKITTGHVGHEWDNYDFKIVIAESWDDTYDLMVKVINPELLPTEHRR